MENNQEQWENFGNIALWQKNKHSDQKEEVIRDQINKIYINSSMLLILNKNP